MVGYLALAAVGMLLLGIVAGVVTSEMLNAPKAAPVAPVKRRSSRPSKTPREGSPAEAAEAAFRSLARRSK